ncbi:hypothetical protein [Xylanibacter rodentium]|uniref:hypothetical protein n=1 Tax=Xylanibacter rodentium TaxID=2736289 RepID=UPI000FFED623|nr:hypothetical protein [Xylanibacter rodentium]RXE71464.1 hypothetical protein ED352_05105 [Muribaculaceae bacterium Isolate-002 (NCI)]
MDIYDENKAVEHINNTLKGKGLSTYPEDEILNVIDMIWDYYEENGLLEIDDDFEADDDEDISGELCDYIKRMLKKDSHAVIKVEDVPVIVDAELEYEDSVL